MPNLWKIDRILELLKHAGATALAYYDAPETELKSDRSVVTRADREIEAYLAGQFDRPACGSSMIGEETVDRCGAACLETALRQNCFIVDPIDGTASYAAQMPLWGISVGLAENGVLTEGAIYMPFQDEAFLTCRGTLWRAANLQGGTPDVAPFQPVKMEDSPAGAVGISQRCAKHARIDFPNQAFAWASCVGNFYTMLRGRTLACLLNCKLWDCAGGIPLLRAAGFSIRTRAGRELGMKLADEFRLDENAKYRWHLKEAAVAAPSPETAAHIWSGIHESS